MLNVPGRRTRQTHRSVGEAFVDEHLEDDLHGGELRVLHGNLDAAAVAHGHGRVSREGGEGAAAGTLAAAAIDGNARVETADVGAADDLAEPAVLGAAHFDEFATEEEEVGAAEGDLASTTYKLHDDAARDLAMLIDVHGAILVAQEKFKARVVEPKHAQRTKVLQTRCNRCRCRVPKVDWQRERRLFVQRE